jgi:hypothetical protein
MFCVRARLQSCRKVIENMLGFSPCGTAFLRNCEFFRNLYRRPAQDATNHESARGGGNGALRAEAGVGA